MRDGSRRLTKNRNSSGNVVEDIRSRGGTCEVSRDEHARVSPVTAIKKKTLIVIHLLNNTRIPPN